MGDETRTRLQADRIIHWCRLFYLGCLVDVGAVGVEERGGLVGGLAAVFFGRGNYLPRLIFAGRRYFVPPFLFGCLAYGSQDVLGLDSRWQFVSNWRHSRHRVPSPPPRQAARRKTSPGGGADPPTAPRAYCGPFLTRRCTRRQPRAEAPGDCPRYAAPLRPPCGGLRPPSARWPLGAGGEPRARPPSPVSRLPASKLPPSAPRVRQSRTTPPRRGGPWLPATRSPRTPRAGGEQPRRPDPPRPSDFAPLSFSPLWKPPIRISPRAVHRRKGGNRKGGEAATFSLIGYAAPKRGPKVGRIRTAAIRRSPLQSEQPRQETPAPGLATLAAGVRRADRRKLGPPVSRTPTARTPPPAPSSGFALHLTHGPQTAPGDPSDPGTQPAMNAYAMLALPRAPPVFCVFQPVGSIIRP